MHILDLVNGTSAPKLNQSKSHKLVSGKNIIFLEILSPIKIGLYTFGIFAFQKEFDTGGILLNILAKKQS